MNADESSTLAEYTYDQAGRPVSMRRSSGTYYYIYNARGDVTALVDSNGAVTNSYSYDPWGKPMSTSEHVTNPYRYASYRYDSETGLYYLQNRYYSPELMKFLTRDPLKDQMGEAVISNYYSYAESNPVANCDPSGLISKSTRNKDDYCGNVLITWQSTISGYYSGRLVIWNKYSTTFTLSGTIYLYFVSWTLKNFNGKNVNYKKVAKNKKYNAGSYTITVSTWAKVAEYNCTFYGELKTHPWDCLTVIYFQSDTVTV